MKKLISLMIIAAMLVTAALTLSVSAEESELIFDLRPQEDNGEDVQKVSGCELEYEDDGTVIVTLTAATATIDLTFVSGGTILYGEEINLGETAAVVCVDYASADGVTFDQTVQAHYTRKDKEAAGTVADLWLTSMESADYAKYQKISYKGSVGEGVVGWDWGTYVSSSDSKLFDNKCHRFTSISYILHGEVGKKMYIYKFGVYNGSEVELGTRRPEPTPEPVVESSEETIVESSEEPIEPVEGDGFNFLTAAKSAKVNSSITGGDISVFLPGFNMENSNTKWSINVHLKKVENGVYEVVEAAAEPTGAGNWAGTLAEDEVLLAVHSDGSDNNVEGKAAALALKAGDRVELVFDETAGTVTRAFAGISGEDIPVESSEEPVESSEEPVESKEESKEESKPAESAAESKAEESKPEEKKGGLGTGAIIGIVVAAVAVIGGAAAFIIKKKKA